LYKENSDIVTNLTVTPRCHARCKDCINGSLTFAGGTGTEDLECDPERDADLVLQIAARYPGREITLCFYGGEPFLAADKMHRVRELLDSSEAARHIRYMVYTGGEHMAGALENYPDLVRGMWLYSVSIDGSSNQHEKVRPGTVLSNIVINLEELRRVYSGNILMWSVLREEQSLLDCFRQFVSLHRSGLADHFFWHWADTRQPYNDFKDYLKKYEEELNEVMKHYVSWISDGEILPIGHISELILMLSEGKNRGHTACGVELAENYDIMGGAVHACADLPSSIGAFVNDGGVDIPAATLQSLADYKQELGCYSCGAHWYCGGRCPVQALAGSRERTLQVCKLMKLHVSTVKKNASHICKMLKKHGISSQQLYDRSAFITRYTDVVP
jgi:uncharacterized protein